MHIHINTTHIRNRVMCVECDSVVIYLICVIWYAQVGPGSERDIHNRNHPAREKKRERVSEREGGWDVCVYICMYERERKRETFLRMYMIGSVTGHLPVRESYVVARE